MFLFFTLTRRIKTDEKEKVVAAVFFCIYPSYMFCTVCTQGQARGMIGEII